MLGLYLHIPFCASICNYCNFNRGLFDAALKERYVAALEREIRRAGDGSAADTVFFGGGTPSLLEPAEIARLIDACRDGFALHPEAEITLETNPETSTPARMEQFRAAGVNRVSLGVQSFREPELRRLGRIHSSDRAREAVREAQTAGFDNISLDLMMWLPQQSRDDWRFNVETLIDVAPEHASLYLLELYPNAALKEEMARAGWSQAPDDDAAEMYLWGLERLERGGYWQYEISNVCRPGRESRHNLKYWQDGDWLGFGCGAHSTRTGVRWRNVSSTEEYIGCIEDNDLRDRLRRSVVAERRQLVPSERLEEALFTGLRLNKGVDLDDLGSRYGADIWARYGTELQPFLDEKLVIREPPRVRLSREGMLIANEILQVFV
jgi:oxygen-independent coproporphyrinogen-3 oxidase